MATHKSRSKLVLVAVLAVLAMPTAASADPTGSQITTPASPAFVQFDFDNPGTLHVAGTTSGGSGNVDLRCYLGATSKTVATNVPVDAGQFATDVQLSTSLYAALTYPQPYCVLRAVPAGTTPAAPPDQASEWQGPDVAFGETERHTLGASGGSNPPDTVRDYYVGQAQKSGFNDFDSISSCGLCDTYLFAPGTHAPSNPIWWANAAVYRQISYDFPKTRSALQVDGVDAYGGAGAFLAGLFASAPYPAVAYSQHVDQQTGALTIDEQQTFSTCSPQPALFPPTAVSCATFVPAVKVARHIVSLRDGSQVAVVDDWSSADGKPHQLDAYYDEETRDVNNAQAGHATDWNFDWTGAGYKTYPADTPIPVAGSERRSVYVKTDASTPAAGDGMNPIGALTYGRQPDGIALRVPVDASHGVGDFQSRYEPAIPATGSVTIAQVYSHGYAQSDVDALEGEARKLVAAPAVTIAAPEDGASGSEATVHVTGTASSADGSPALKVNGTDVPVAGDGSWSADVPLSEGANTITAVASNSIGISSQATRSVSRVTLAVAADPPVTPAQGATVPAAKPLACHVPKLAGRTLRDATTRLRRAHCRVGKLTRRQSTHLRPGRIIGSKPGAGRLRPAGTRIALTVAKKR